VASMRMSIEHPPKIVVPEKYRQAPRLELWYKSGFNQARRGLTPTEAWLRRMDQDKAVSEAFRAGHRAGKSTRD
jgi:hypothetical protein